MIATRRTSRCGLGFHDRRKTYYIFPRGPAVVNTAPRDPEKIGRLELRTLGMVEAAFADNTQRLKDAAEFRGGARVSPLRLSRAIENVRRVWRPIVKNSPRARTDGDLSWTLALGNFGSVQ